MNCSVATGGTPPTNILRTDFLLTANFPPAARAAATCVTPTAKKVTPTISTDAPSDAGYDRGYEESARSAYADERGARAYSGGLYEFTRNDAERASGEDLYDRLSATGTASAAKTAGYERAARESYVSEDYAAKYRAEHKTKKKARFGLKAKLIIAAYVIVVAIVGILIIVNAKPLNNGTAAVPSSSVVAVE